MQAVKNYAGGQLTRRQQGGSNERIDEKRKELEENWNKKWDARISNQLGALGYNNSNMLVLEKQDNLLRNGYGSILLRVDNILSLLFAQIFNE